MGNIYEASLAQNRANYTPLSPLTFLERSANTHPNRIAVVHGKRRYTWSEMYARVRRLASTLSSQYQLGLGDTISALCYNTPEMLELHFAVPMIGAVLHSINTRLDAKTIAFQLDHAESKLLFVDTVAHQVVSDALEMVQIRPKIVNVDDALGPGGQLIGEVEYEQLIDAGDPDYAWSLPADEWQAISLNYTSGTTGNPKGVVYHHRGAYLNSLGDIMAWDLGKFPTYLWTLPMFHCNGWCFPWAIAAVSGTNVCLRSVDVNEIYRLIAEEHVTHYCGAPIVHQMIANAPDELKALKTHFVKGMVAGAPPPAAVLAAMAANGFEITHVYGLTETYGPATVCEWKPEWDAVSAEDQAELKARQGVRYHMLEELTVMNPDTMEVVEADGKTLGEVMFRGNVVMKGYLKNPETTDKAFANGYFHSGDLGVLHPDGYVELKDRSKDIIISGGENISTIEVENAIFKHPAVMDAAVVAKPHAKWGETPCAFVTLREGAAATEREIIDFCRDNLAHYKCPTEVVFGPLPKTSTGKTQKFVLREAARAATE